MAKQKFIRNNPFYMRVAFRYNIAGFREYCHVLDDLSAHALEP